MSDKPQDWDRSRDEIISGEYVLGVLSEADRKRVEARIASDPKFAMQVRRWQENLADFNDDYEDVKPPAAVYRKVETRLFGAEAARPTGLARWWNSVGLWRGLTVAAALVAVYFGVAGHIAIPGLNAPEPPLVAQLNGQNSPFNLVATYDYSTGRLSVVPAALKQEQPKSLEVWVIEDGKAPMSVGVLPDSGRGDIVIASALRDNFRAGRTIAITVEPLGGSPTGKPTGPIVAAGKAALL
jgi:anti-sigma-K factor RskA